MLITDTSFSHCSVCRIRDCLTQLYAKDITPDDKHELDEALQREVCGQQCTLLDIMCFL